MRRPLRLAALLPALPLVVACGGPARVELDPGSLRLFGRGQSARVHALPRGRNGAPMPDQACRWSTSDPKVAVILAAHNTVTVTSVGPGSAVVRCQVGSVQAELPVAVRTVARVTAAPAEVTVPLRDDRTPVALRVEVFDEDGAPVGGRIAVTSCADDEVCRGDARGQLWATGPGRTTATVSVDGVSASVAVVVPDERTDLTRPSRVRRGYMEDLEREVRRKQAAEAAGAR
jgi:hypothetical protein